jgi:hypothetical protein
MHHEKQKLGMQFVDQQFLQNKSRDPYDFINRKTQNIQINPGVAYKSTSNDEVLEPRFLDLQ